MVNGSNDVMLVYEYRGGERVATAVIPPGNKVEFVGADSLYVCTAKGQL